MTEKDDRVRIDKWLWAARFYKTRTLAADAVDGGKVTVNGDRVKPARLLRVGDELAVQISQVRQVVQVRALSDRRGPAPQARLLYEETADSQQRRAEDAERRRLLGDSVAGKGRPTKRLRRDLQRIQGAYEEQ